MQISPVSVYNTQSKNYSNYNKICFPRFRGGEPIKVAENVGKDVLKKSEESVTKALETIVLKRLEKGDTPPSWLKKYVDKLRLLLQNSRGEISNEQISLFERIFNRMQYSLEREYHGSRPRKLEFTCSSDAVKMVVEALKDSNGNLDSNCVSWFGGWDGGYNGDKRDFKNRLESFKQDKIMDAWNCGRPYYSIDDLYEAIPNIKKLKYIKIAEGSTKDGRHFAVDNCRSYLLDPKYEKFFKQRGFVKMRACNNIYLQKNNITLYMGGLAHVLDFYNKTDAPTTINAVEINDDIYTIGDEEWFSAIKSSKYNSKTDEFSDVKLNRNPFVVLADILQDLDKVVGDIKESEKCVSHQ